MIWKSWFSEWCMGLKGFWRGYREQPLAVLAALVVLAFLLVAILAPALAPYDPHSFVEKPFQFPNLKHPMGTDHYGRDSFSRVIWGTRTSLLVALGAVGVAAGLGILIGAISGFYGGFLDDILSRLTEVFIMIPMLFLVILIVALFGSKLSLIIFAIGLTAWPANARIMRSQVMRLKTLAFVQAAIVSGIGNSAVIFRHIVPNGIYPVVVNAALQMGGAVLTESGLAFLGLGNPDLISWGSMLRDTQRHLNTAGWMAVFPGLFLFLMVYAFSLLSDGINCAMGSRTSQRSGWATAKGTN